MSAMELPSLASNAGGAVGYYQKGIRFSDHEKQVFIEILQEHQNIINCPHHDGMTMARKEQEWQAITDKFNCRESVFTRDIKQLKCLWKNLKARTKKFVLRDRHCNRYEALGIRKMPVNPELSKKVLGMIACELGGHPEEGFEEDTLAEDESTDGVYLDEAKVKSEPCRQEAEENVLEKIIKTEPPETDNIAEIHEEIHQYLTTRYVAHAQGSSPGPESEDGSSSTGTEEVDIETPDSNKVIRNSAQHNGPHDHSGTITDSQTDRITEASKPQKRFIIRSLGKRKRRMSAPEDHHATHYPPVLGSASHEHSHQPPQEQGAGKVRFTAQDQLLDDEEHDTVTKLKVVSQKRLLQMAQLEHEQKMKNLKLKEQILRLQRDKLLADKGGN